MVVKTADIVNSTSMGNKSTTGILADVCMNINNNIAVLLIKKFDFMN